MRKTRDAGLVMAVIVLIMAVVGFRGVLTAPQAYAADPNVDIAAQLTGPLSEYKGKPFTYDLTVSNVGATDAGGSTLTFTAGSGSTGLKIVCASATGGAVCPTNLAVSGLNATGTIATFPAGGVVHLTVTGYFGYDSSATATLSVNPSAGSTDINPVSNTVSQQTSLSGDAVVSVTKTQDKASVVSGEARTYTVTYRNDGPADLLGFHIYDRYAHYSARSSSISLDSTSCVASGGAVCPAATKTLPYVVTNYSEMTPFNAYGNAYLTVSLPAGSSLTFTFTITDVIPCNTQSSLPVDSPTDMDAFLPGAVVKDVSGTVVTSISTTVKGNISSIPACPTAVLSVSKVQDKATVSSGQARTYTLTYRNDGPADLVGVHIYDYYDHTNRSQSITITSISCAVTGGTVCPTQTRAVPYTVTNTTNIEPFVIYGKNFLTVDMPAGSTMEFTMVVVDTFQCSAQSSTTVNNMGRIDTIPVGVTATDTKGTVVDEVVANVNGTIDSIPACPEAVLSVTKTQDKVGVISGEPRTYTLTYRNDGPADLVGIHIFDLYSHAVRSSSISLISASCAATGGAVCPAITRSFPYVVMNSTQLEPFSIYGNNWLSVNMPAGSTLEFKSTITDILNCNDSIVASVSNMGRFDTVPVGIVAKDTSGKIVNEVAASVDGTLDGTSSVDVSTTTSLSTSTPQPLGSLTATSTISNSCHTAINVPVMVKLPRDGFLIDASTLPACTATGGAACPADLHYDSASNAVVGTASSIPANGKITLNLIGTAGVIPPTTASYKVTTSAPVQGDNFPTFQTLNESNATFAYSNVQSPVTAKVTVSGGPAGGWSGSMDGTLVCQNQGSFPFTLSVVNGVSAVTSVVAALWEHDTCTATLDSPAPPQGYKWDKWSSGPSVTKTDMVGIQQFDFSANLIPDITPMVPLLPDTGGRSAVSFTVVGISFLGISLLFVAWKRRRSA
ncbi:LPXTG-motif cell wall-anchored protein/uncharacterized repeat protein (TIGR01451 family) [Arcanobacterium pluranimalium]|uniref:LPXTG cell wall anchor domain-containing protein n=1 Tax=Arcanobacterium pluranimalium TaxID=108028 RepID=UPI00195C6AF9|nr:LPXTG cell wall anchor domain-containing protein [Arcanobacterium pluranimalium]MBM7824764.1 LPXTG-motif cell wall-anchored protein/uncharacterized repeat protein (TIGR01451 family) [Arcanobacterium pluranimalium]